MASHRTRQIAVAGLIAAATAAAGAQVPAPMFRSEIDYVQIPVRALDAHGVFVRGLTQEDFQISEDGVPQIISAFTAVDIPVDATRATSGPPPASNEPENSSEPADVHGRLYMFVLDNQRMDPAIARGLPGLCATNSSYYLLGYHSTNTSTDGKLRVNRVTSRKGVRVVHRRGYLAPLLPPLTP